MASRHKHKRDLFDDDSDDAILEKYRARLRIDRHALDTEVAIQSDSFEKIGRESARLASVRDAAKDRLKAVTGRRSLDIRDSVAKAGKRVTEPKLEAMVLADRERRRAMADLIDAERAAAEAESLKEAWRERGFMLRTLADLFGASYWSDVSIKGGSMNEVAEQAAESVRQRVAKKRKGLQQ